MTGGDWVVCLCRWSVFGRLSSSSDIHRHSDADDDTVRKRSNERTCRHVITDDDVISGLYSSRLSSVASANLVDIHHSHLQARVNQAAILFQRSIYRQLYIAHIRVYFIIIIIVIIDDIYIAQVCTMPQMNWVHSYVLNRRVFNLFLNDDDVCMCVRCTYVDCYYVQSAN